jgi:pimeloyl-ACP methyl ester carboxylesterase
MTTDPLFESPCSRGRRKVAFLVAAVALAGCATPDAGPPAFEHAIRGTGTPAVVFQSGLGDGLSVWKDVQARVQPHATTFVYSRPGYGRSRWTESDRSPCSVADELHALLRASGVSPPYVLVGHSLGGLYQYVFARMYPGEVAGVVLLDPTHPQHWETMQREAPANAALVRVARATFKPPMRREFDDQTRCLERLQSSPMPGVPVRLLVRGRYAGLEAGAFEAMARRLEVDWARRLHALSVQAVDGAGHYLQRDRPDVVADAIVSVVGAARPR